jgi:hypothetical protein
MSSQQSLWDAPAEASERLPVLLLPLNTGALYPIYTEQIAKWQKQYPAVNIAYELQAMQKYFYDDVKRVRTKRGINGFIAHWLGKHQNDGGSRTYAQKSQKPKAQGPAPSYDYGEIEAMLNKITF